MGQITNPFLSHSWSKEQTQLIC